MLASKQAQEGSNVPQPSVYVDNYHKKSVYYGSTFMSIC